MYKNISNNSKSTTSKQLDTEVGGCIKDCVYVHTPEGLNYPWLNDINGGLLKILYMEPPNSNVWKEYSMKNWINHCKINHNPEKLVEAHKKAFVNPKTRFAKLKYIFKNGTETEIDDKHAGIFYPKEAEYFKNKNICLYYQRIK